MPRRTKLKPGDLSLNEVLVRLGYRVVRHRVVENGTKHRSIRLDEEPVRFPEGTLSERYHYVTDLERTSASIVWDWLRRTEQIYAR